MKDMFIQVYLVEVDENKSNRGLTEAAQNSLLRAGCTKYGEERNVSPSDVKVVKMYANWEKSKLVLQTAARMMESSLTLPLVNKDNVLKCGGVFGSSIGIASFNIMSDSIFDMKENKDKIENEIGCVALFLEYDKSFKERCNTKEEDIRNAEKSLKAFIDYDLLYTFLNEEQINNINQMCRPSCN